MIRRLIYAALAAAACTSELPTAPSETSETSAAVVPTAADVTYCTAGGVDLKMDVYQAGAAFARPRPIVVGVHGGGWQGGDKKSDVLMYDVPRWQKKGLTIVSINYRVGQGIFPAYMEDAACAVEHMKANATTYGIDSAKVALWGHSAGGHIAAHTALSRPGLVKAILTYAAPFDPIELQDFSASVQTDIQNVFGPDSIKLAASVSPIAPGEQTPMLMFHGTLDSSIDIAQAERMVGDNRTLTVIINGGHYLTRPSAYQDSVANPSRLQVSNQAATFLITKLNQ
jgi:acetyl esterase/lipase